MKPSAHPSARQCAIFFVLCAVAGVSSVSGQDLVRDSTSVGGETSRVVITGELPEAELPALSASTATRLPARILDTDRSVSVVNRQTIEDRQIIDPQEAVQQVAGAVRAGSDLGYGEDFLIRGFQQQDVFKDGFRAGQNDSTNNSATGPTDVANLERIEFLKGPVAILYGRGEPGGIVNYVTRLPYFDNTFGLKQEVGSYDFFRTEADANWNGLPNKLALRLDASYEHSGSYVDFVHGERTFVAPSLLWQIAPDTTLTFRGEFSRDRRNPLAGLPYYDGAVVSNLRYGVFLGEPGFDLFHTDEYRGLLTLEHKWTENIITTVSVHGRYATNDGAYVFIANNTFDPVARTVGRYVDVNSYDDRNYNVRVDQVFNWTLYQGRDVAPAPARADGQDGGKDKTVASADTHSGGGFPTVKNQLLLTPEYERQTVFSDRAYNALGSLSVDAPRYAGFVPIDGPAFRVFDHTAASSYSGLVLDRLSVGDTLYLSGGVRVEQFDATFIDTYAPYLGIPRFRQDTRQLTVNPSAGAVLKPTHATSLYFSYAESTNSFNNLTALTRDGSTVDPEHARAYEFGAKAEFLDAKLLATVAVFQITKDNVAATDPTDQNFSVNAGTQRSRGFEFELNGQPLPGWRLNLNYAYTDARITSAPDGLNVGNRFYGVPYNAGGFFTTYEVQQGPLKGLGGGGGVYFVDKIQLNNDNTLGQLSGYALTDLVAFYRRGPYSVQLNVKNAADNHYYGSSNQTSYVLPGTPRTFIGTVAVKF